MSLILKNQLRLDGKSEITLVKLKFTQRNIHAQREENTVLSMKSEQ